MYWGKYDDPGEDYREQERRWRGSNGGRDWRSEAEREREWETTGRQWRREPRDWGREEAGPGRRWAREARDWWSRMAGQRARDWEREASREREDWPARESWERGPHAGAGREYRAQEWRPPGYAAADYGRPTWGYGGPGAWRELGEPRYRERGGEGWGLAWPDWTRERRSEQRAPKGYKRSDRRIMEDVCDAFMMDDRLDPREIEVEVLEGVVILRGTVNRRHEKYLAEDIADRVLGVKDVENQIRISHPAEAPREPARAAEPQPAGGGI